MPANGQSTTVRLSMQPSGRPAGCQNYVKGGKERKEGSNLRAGVVIRKRSAPVGRPVPNSSSSLAGDIRLYSIAATRKGVRGKGKAGREREQSQASSICTLSLFPLPPRSGLGLSVRAHMIRPTANGRKVHSLQLSFNGLTVVQSANGADIVS